MADRSAGAVEIDDRTCVRLLSMEKRKHYWNGRWGRLARHDVLLYEDAGLWAVEHRIGGVEGWVRRQEFEQEDGALDHVRDLLDASDNWVEL